MLPAGQTLSGRYRLEEPIGTGGMGAVWRATDLTLGRVVAVKTLRPDLTDDAGFDARFRAEARTLAVLTHPNVVNIYDYGRCTVAGRDVAYLVMSYVDGQPLSQRLTTVGRLSVTETMSIVAQAAEALHAAHRLGIVHRDVKPANLLVRPDGSVTLVDFGVARSPVATSLNTGKMVLGSAHYMAPEQASARGVSPATDVYALGVVAYHCLAGQPPFAAESALEIALKHVLDQPPPLPADIPLAVRHLVARAMAKDPAERYPSAAALGAAAAGYAHRVPLADAATAPVPVPEPAPGPGDTVPLAPVRRRHRRTLLVGALAGVLLAFGGLAFALRPAPPAGANEPRQPVVLHSGSPAPHASTLPVRAKSPKPRHSTAPTTSPSPVTAHTTAPATRAPASPTVAPSPAAPTTGAQAPSPSPPAAQAASPTL